MIPNISVIKALRVAWDGLEQHNPKASSSDVEPLTCCQNDEICLRLIFVNEFESPYEVIDASPVEFKVDQKCFPG